MKEHELVAMVGNDNVDYVMSLILQSMNRGDIVKIIYDKISSIDMEILELKEKGVIYSKNGSDYVDWNYDEDYTIKNHADILLYTRNRLLHILAVKL